MTFVKLFFLVLIQSSAYSFSLIDLGNLEVEGEVRRPMIRLFNNTIDQKNRIDIFARKIANRRDFVRFKFIDVSSLDEFFETEENFTEIE